MSLPRPVIAGETILITRRCTQRQFLLRPSSAVNGLIGYCLAVAAERYGRSTTVSGFSRRLGSFAKSRALSLVGRLPPASSLLASRL